MGAIDIWISAGRAIATVTRRFFLCCPFVNTLKEIEEKEARWKWSASLLTFDTGGKERIGTGLGFRLACFFFVCQRILMGNSKIKAG